MKNVTTILAKVSTLGFFGTMPFVSLGDWAVYIAMIFGLILTVVVTIEVNKHMNWKQLEPIKIVESIEVEDTPIIKLLSVIDTDVFVFGNTYEYTEWYHSLDRKRKVFEMSGCYFNYSDYIEIALDGLMSIKLFDDKSVSIVDFKGQVRPVVAKYSLECSDGNGQCIALNEELSTLFKIVSDEYEKVMTEKRKYEELKSDLTPVPVGIDKK